MAAHADLELIQKIWPEVPSLSEEYDAYLQFLNRMSLATFAREQNFGQDFACASYSLVDTLRFIDTFRQAPLSTANPSQVAPLINIQRADVVFRFKHLHLQQLGIPPCPDAALINSLCAAISMWATIEINTHNKSALWITKPSMGWSDTQTLCEVINRAVPIPQTAGTTEKLIHAKLTMEYLCKYHAFNMLWTNDLTEHLSITWGGGPENSSIKPTINVYRHKVFLRNELTYYPERSILPKRLMEETLDSLNLLFPYNDQATKQFLKKQPGGQSFYNMGWCSRPRVLDSTQYVYWGKRILHLSDVCEGSPVGFAQLLPDRDGRNVIQSVNFWTASWVGALTIVSVGFGVASIILSKQALDLTRRQWELSLAQACASDGAGDLAEFCA